MAGTFFDNGTIGVFVPEGWKAFEGIDSEGRVTHKKILVYKNVEIETDIFLRTGITVCFFGESDFYLSPKWFYDDVCDIDGFSLGHHDFTGYTCTSLGYPYVMLESMKEGTVFQIMILLENGEEKISLDDADVKEILESIVYVGQKST
ncbi:MAG: hypothetical protein E7656_07550 [Ruminococcaceae bacterium]|nr:hypothetical protein [Oscillospiraceae bacterium]